MPLESSHRGPLATTAKLLTVAATYGLVAWLNVEYTFRFAEWLVAQSRAFALPGAYLPHLICLVIVVGGLLIGWGRLSLADLGLATQKLLPAVIATLGFWVATETWKATQTTAAGGGWQWHAGATPKAWAQMFVNLLVTQLLGNALLEEIVFRGYFLQQISHRCRNRWNSENLTSASIGLAAGILVSLFLFTIIHLPIRLDRGLTGYELLANLLRVAMWGLVFSLIFVATDNLWLAVGIHALTNRPCELIVAGETSTRSIQLYLSIILIIVAVVWNLRKPPPKLASERRR